MVTIPAKLTERLVGEVDVLVKEGLYASRSEAIRDAVRRLVEEMSAKLLEQAIREDIEWGLHGK
ncbi:MAG TPA: ribbon-helix-helix domain-containing protein [archaeon]|nr:ribbon-helix-helix domain-containing protein [archaeon]HLD81255.1 ribbon-helix-helix domain-containing protein [archaeon]